MTDDHISYTGHDGSSCILCASRILPILPLDLVLFPRQELPVRVVEPQYRQLIDDCMATDGQFGVCMLHHSGGQAGHGTMARIGTVAKITECKDVELGAQLQVVTVGRNKFGVCRFIPASAVPPQASGQGAADGGLAVHGLAGSESTERMYVRAEVEMIPEIDEAVPVLEWEGLVGMWKEMIKRRAAPRTIEPEALNQALREYYLVTDAPTIDYVYSLSALAASEPADLQPILEAEDMDDLLRRVKSLMTAN